MEPRPITITSLTVIAWENPRLTLAIECSKGTYIRSLAYDLGEQLDHETASLGAECPADGELTAALTHDSYDVLYLKREL